MHAIDSQQRMRAMVHEHCRFVANSLRRAGVPPSDLDDEVQRTFIVAAGRLQTVLPADERKFLLGVAVNMAWHARRSLARRREVPIGQLPERAEPLGTPEHLVERKRLRQLVDRVLNELDEPLRAVLTLHELEEMTSADIAVRLAIPPGTVASRLRRARVRFRACLGEIDVTWRSPGAGSARKPRVAAVQKVSALGQALLEAGASAVECGTTRDAVLAALGLSPESLSEA